MEPILFLILPFAPSTLLNKLIRFVSARIEQIQLRTPLGHTDNILLTHKRSYQPLTHRSAPDCGGTNPVTPQFNRSRLVLMPIGGKRGLPVLFLIKSSLCLYSYKGNDWDC